MDTKSPSELPRSTITFSGPDPSELAGFWSEYDKLADAYDKDMIDALSNNLESLLIFAGLFSGVNSTALFYSLSSLSANPADTTNALLVILIQQSANGNGSSSSAAALKNQIYTSQRSTVQTNAFFAASLVTSLLAAFGAVFARQWLLHYTQTGQIGALETQCRRRQKKFAGAKRWRLEMIVEALPVLLQISLLAFSVGLIDFFWALNRPIAVLVIVLTGLAFLVYIVTIVSAVLYPDCPFQTYTTELILRIVKKLANTLPRRHRGTLATLKAELPSAHVCERSENGGGGVVRLMRRIQERLGVGEGGFNCTRDREGSKGVVAGLVTATRLALRTVGIVSSDNESRNEARIAEEVKLHRECVMWTLEVADKKESILEAASSIPTFRTIEACQAILRHCTRPTTTKAFNRLLTQLQTSLLDARAHRHSTSAPWKDVIILGRALIHILLPVTPISIKERSAAWIKLSKFWPGDELSYIDGFSELLSIALSIAPTPPKPLRLPQ
ncbi:hypothetical protein FRB96_005805 [Tulasnella sp. 330]|nr:hypothetical protein FRB96_005805 [Tulasnella sp. 330]